MKERLREIFRNKQVPFYYKEVEALSVAFLKEVGFAYKGYNSELVFSERSVKISFSFLRNSPSSLTGLSAYISYDNEVNLVLVGKDGEKTELGFQSLKRDVMMFEWDLKSFNKDNLSYFILKKTSTDNSNHPSLKEEGCLENIRYSLNIFLVKGSLNKDDGLNNTYLSFFGLRSNNVEEEIKTWKHNPYTPLDFWQALSFKMSITDKEQGVLKMIKILNESFYSVWELRTKKVLIEKIFKNKENLVRQEDDNRPYYDLKEELFESGSSTRKRLSQKGISYYLWVSRCWMALIWGLITKENKKFHEALYLLEKA